MIGSIAKSIPAQPFYKLLPLSCDNPDLPMDLLLISLEKKIKKSNLLRKCERVLAVGILETRNSAKREGFVIFIVNL